MIRIGCIVVLCNPASADKYDFNVHNGVALRGVADEVAKHLDRLHRRVDVVLLRLVVLHDRGLRAVGEPSVRRTLAPPVEARLVNPMVVLQAEDERVLLPDEALPHAQPHVEARATEVVAFRVGVEDVERAARLERLIASAMKYRDRYGRAALIKRPHILTSRAIYQIASTICVTIFHCQFYSA